MLKFFQVGKDDRETLRAEYERLTALGIDMEHAWCVEHWPGGWVRVYRYATRNGQRYLVPGTEHMAVAEMALAEPTWHRVTS